MGFGKSFPFRTVDCITKATPTTFFAPKINKQNQINIIYVCVCCGESWIGCFGLNAPRPRQHERQTSTMKGLPWVMNIISIVTTIWQRVRNVVDWSGPEWKWVGWTAGEMLVIRASRKSHKTGAQVIRLSPVISERMSHGAVTALATRRERMTHALFIDPKCTFDALQCMSICWM